MKNSILICFILALFTACNCDDNNNCVAIDNPDCACPEYWEPLCGCDGATYSNICFLECVGLDQYAYEEGECE